MVLTWQQMRIEEFRSHLLDPFPPYFYTFIFLKGKKSLAAILGTLLRASAMYYVGVAERSGTAQPDPLPKGSFWVKDLAMR